MRRPLAPLKLAYWGSSVPSYEVQKLSDGRGVVKIGPDYGNTFDADEVRQLYAWLGKVVEDLDNGV